MAQMTEESGLPLRCVSNLERGRGNPTIEALRPNAEALQPPAADILSRNGSAPRTSRFFERGSGYEPPNCLPVDLPGAEHGQQPPIRGAGDVLADHPGQRRR